MLLESAKVIFVHVPKTAGNYCSNVFIDCGLASDGKIITGHQDGVDRFEIRGDFTETKHQTLATYRTALKDEFAEYTVLTVLRDPIERLTSLYLSPHRWMVERFSTRMFVRPWVGFGRKLGSWTENALGVGRVDKLRQYRCVEPRHVDYDEFSRLVRDARSTSQFLALTEGSQPRSFWPLEFKSLTSDLERFLSLNGVEKRLPTR